MVLEIIGPSFQTPANGSRSFLTREEALKQPLGDVQFSWDTSDPYLFNINFDEKLILFDSSYNTSVSGFYTQTDIPTLNYFNRVLHNLTSNPKIIEIGCGQGELISELLNRSHNAIGYDPTLRKPSDFLFKAFYDPDLSMHLACDLFILRCVLPHIKDPFVFLQKLFLRNSDASVLIEYQKIEFMHQHKLWFNLGHGHVNQFTLKDFQDRFNIIESGEFKNGEWQWLLINSKNIEFDDEEYESNIKIIVPELIEEKNKFLIRAQHAGPLAIYGAAGKGIMLAEACVSAGAEVVCAIDMHESKIGKYLEVSGVQVISPKAANDELPYSTNILVTNPNHLRTIELYFNRNFNVILPSEL